MNLPHHLVYVRMARAALDSPERVRRREILHELEEQARGRRAQRRSDLFRRALAVVTPRRWGSGRKLAGRAG